MTLPAAGDLFAGRYKVERELGSGGFATVYLARETTTNREVALKLLHQDDGDRYQPATRARFLREAEALARVDSPHIVALVDHGDDDGWLYLATEYVGGTDLSDDLRVRGQFDEADVVHILRQLLDALGEAHAAGVLHRDIKPENIRILRRGDDPHFVKLLDFGLARPTDDGHPSVTKTGELTGTPRYMSPEQLTEKPLTPASDIYSLGVVVLELLLGRGALHGNTWTEQLDRLHTGHVFSAPQLERVSPRLRQAIAEMTSTRVEDRLATIAAVRRVLDDQPQLAAEAVKRADARSRFGLVVLVIGCVAVVVVIALVFSGDETPTTNVPIANPAGLMRTHEPVPDAAKSAPAPAAATLDTGTIEAGTIEAAADVAANACEANAPFVGERGQLDEVTTYIPQSYEPGVRHPLVILVHQWDASGARMLDFTKFEQFADRDGVVLVAPNDAPKDGLVERIAGAWTDLSPVIRAKETAVRRLCIDPERIVLVGHASGGGVTYQLACEPWVAGIVANAFRLKEHETLESMCRPTEPIPHLLLSPKHSDVDPFEGGASKCEWSKFLGPGAKRSVADQEALWRVRNRCGAKRKPTRREGDSQCYEWDCEVPFQSCHVDGDFRWPGASARGCAGREPDFPTSEIAWNFVRSIIGK